ncbi:unnamed protein product [Cuscuta epithymum]|uniref:DDT domain-containing protein n=1 Tax=Cuscuta epithymum TaxID=186058 RepID=A0AAV0E850_9ASTE|nr:unnamed protein product [Cuscuta epithymum]
MAVSGDSVAEQKQSKQVKPRRRNNCSSVRVVGNRIYDSQNGKSCHQCRQKTMDFMLACKNPKDFKPCTIRFCHKCLLNRYGEKAEEVATKEDWLCPKCRGICNCSLCMKKRGYQPTGNLAHTVKATGCPVSEMIKLKESENTDHVTSFKSCEALPKTTTASNKGAKVLTSTKCGKENTFSGNIRSNDQPYTSSCNPTEQESRKVKRGDVMEIQCNGGNDNVLSRANDNSPNKSNFKKAKQEHLSNTTNICIPLPLATGLTTVAGNDLPPDDVGGALQFLEFCAAFGKILDLKKGQAEAVLRDLVGGRISRRGKTNVTAQFLTQLLSFIEEEHEVSSNLARTDGKGLWFDSLKELISESPSVSKHMGLDSLTDGFDDLSPSKKLKLLNFVCDEVLDTVRIRDWIDDQNLKCAEKAKEAREKVSAAREEEKRLKQKIQDDVAAAIIAKNGAPISVSEHDAIVIRAKHEAAEAHAALLQTKGYLLKCSQRSDAVRTEPIFLDTNGQVFWRLKCYSNKSEILLQELGTDAITSDEKWLAFDEAHQETVDMCINSRRKKFMAPVVQFIRE